jgi:hypothetical protein
MCSWQYRVIDLLTCHLFTFGASFDVSMGFKCCCRNWVLIFDTEFLGYDAPAPGFDSLRPGLLHVSPCHPVDCVALCRVVIILDAGLVVFVVLGYVGRAVAQAVSRWPPTAAARVRVWAACGVCGGQSGIGTGFLRVLRCPLPIIPPISPSW